MAERVGTADDAGRINPSHHLTFNKLIHCIYKTSPNLKHLPVRERRSYADIASAPFFCNVVRMPSASLSLKTRLPRA